MEKRIVKRQAGKILAVAAATAGLAAFGASKADASLIVDVRATGVTGGTLVNNKTITAGVGSTVTMDVIARLQGQNSAQITNKDYDSDGNNDRANDDTLQILVGSLKSSTGGLLGNMQLPLTQPPWKAAGSLGGVLVDSDADTDLDIGQYNSTDPASMWNIHSAITTGAASFLDSDGTTVLGTGFTSGTTQPKNKLIDASTSEMLLGTFKFVVTGSGGTSAVNFVIRPGGDAGSALWFEDGAPTSLNPTTGSFSVGSPVNVTVAAVPEPSSIGLLALASVGLLARRRDKKA